MRVVEVISGLGLGGAERALVQRLRNAPRGVVTRVISTRPDLSELNDFVSEYAELVVLHRNGRLGISAIRAAVDDFRPDVVVSHNPIEAVRLLSHGAFARAHRVVPVAHSDRASFSPLLGPALGLALRLINRRAAGHIAVSQLSAEGQQCAGSRQVNVVHLGGSLDPDSTPVDSWPAGTKRRWIAIGRFVSPKNFDGLLRAIAGSQDALKAAGVHLLLVGYGEQEQELRRLLRELKIQGIVSVYGAVADPSALLRCADVLVISSMHEGGPITAYEAELAGCRIVATPVGVCPEIVSSDSESILSDGTSDSAIARALALAVEFPPISDAARRARSAAAARWDVRTTSADFYSALSGLSRPQ